MNYRKKNVNHRTAVIYFFIVYLIYLFIITLCPYKFSLLESENYFALSLSKKLELLFQPNLSDSFFNIILFIPLGLFLFYLFKNRKINYLLTITAGILLSFSIEIMQIFTDRFTSFWDLFSNLSGTLIGFWGMRSGFFQRRIFPVLKKFWCKRVLRIIILFIWTGILFVIFYYPYKVNTMENWDVSFPLLFGNEATLDRPWKGDIYSAAIYSKSMAADDVRDLFSRGYQNSIEKFENKKGIVLYYRFKEGSGSIIHDELNKNYSVDLKAENLEWLGNNGIRIDSSSRIRSISSTDNLVNHLKNNSEISIEAWLRTADLDQIGPARIISLSTDIYTRNFTLGQNGRDIHLRLRTPVAGANGIIINLIARSVLSDKKLHHIIAVFDHGFERIFIDGKPAGGLLRADIDYLPFMFGLGRTAVSKSCFLFLLFIPLGFLLMQAFLKFNIPIIIAVTVFLIGCEQYFYLIFTGQPFGFELFINGVVFSIIGGFAGYLSRST